MTSVKACWHERPRDSWKSFKDLVNVSESQKMNSRLCYFHPICPAAHRPGKIQRINWSPRSQSHGSDTVGLQEATSFSLLLLIVFDVFPCAFCSRKATVADTSRLQAQSLLLDSLHWISFLVRNFSYIQLWSYFWFLLLLYLPIENIWNHSMYVFQWRSVIQWHCKSSWSVMNLHLSSPLNR